MTRWHALAKSPLDTHDAAHLNILRFSLLDFIGDFANWDCSTIPEYLETARALTQAAHEALGGEPGTRPLVVDPFAGGGSIPLEALRVGADAFASDLNPVAVLLNKVVLEYIPKYGQKLADEVRKWGQWIKEQAEKELAEFYPKDPDGATPIAYLWARTITCEGPGCGAEVPLIRSLWLARKDNRVVALRMVPRPRLKKVDFEIVEAPATRDVSAGTVARGSATCPVCGFTTPVAAVRRQLKTRKGGAHDAQLVAVVTVRPSEQGRSYRLPTDKDLKAVRRAVRELERRQLALQREPKNSDLSIVPDELISPNELRRISVPIYGMERWGDLFTPRQSLAISTLARLIENDALRECKSDDVELTRAALTFVGIALSRFTDICNALCMWETSKTQVRHLFTRQAIGMLWDFAEPNVFADAAGNFSVTFDTMLDVLDRCVGAVSGIGHVEQSSAVTHPLPDDAAAAIITDPPYYDAVPYAHLSDFFYVWLRRTLAHVHPAMFQAPAVPKDSEIVVDRPHQLSRSNKDIAFYERELQLAFGECRRVVRPDGIGTIVFASKTTASWEAILKATVEAGWIIKGSWPIDTELENRVAAQGQARLASSVHLVCRPREAQMVGDWRDVLSELPKRIHEWMPRLASEGVVGADAIFACLGPALEIFSRFARVEKASGERVELKDYLEQVWAAVAKEALSMIFAGADTTGFDPDARRTAMWLWTVGQSSSPRVQESSSPGANASETSEETDENVTEGLNDSKTERLGGLTLEFDAARKIAQGLGAHLEQLTHVVEVKGDSARLLPVAERAKHLFGKDEPAAPKRRKKERQPTLFEELEQASGEEGGWGEMSVPQLGTTTLDRIHQGMILFAAGRGDALKRFLVEEGVGRDTRFWRLAQALSALYPSGTEEKRWVDGVLARKKGLGF